MGNRADRPAAAAAALRSARAAELLTKFALVISLKIFHTRAIKRLDPEAEVGVDLPTGRVSVTG
ncbi:MAG: hypothetical protein ACLQJR_20470, partial [Stellaceae bacterium]